MRHNYEYDERHNYECDEGDHPDTMTLAESLFFALFFAFCALFCLASLLGACWALVEFGIFVYEVIAS